MMAGTNTRWQERCERYFSSMVDVRHQHKSHAKDTSKRADLYMVDENDYPLRKEPVTTFSRKRQPAKGLIRWLSSLDLHGMRMLLRARSFSYCALWITISILATAVFCVGAYLLIKEYSQSSHVFRTSTSDNGANASPLSLLVCNANRIRKSQIEDGSRFERLKNITLENVSSSTPVQNTNKLSVSDLLRRSNLKSFLEEQNMEDVSSVVLADINDEFNVYSEMTTDSDWINLAQYLLTTNSNPFPHALHMTSAEMRDLGHDMENAILRCAKNGRPCASTEIINSQSTVLGNCAVVYLSLGNSWFDRLTLTVDAQPEDYLELVSPAPGIQVIVQSSSSSSPPSLSESTFVSPGDGIRLTLAKGMEIKRKSSECESDSNYSQQECISRCQQLLTARTCGCSISLESPLTQRCKVNSQYEFVCQRFLQVLTERNQLPCDCLHPCKEESISVSKSNYRWLSNNTEPLIRASLERSIGPWNSTVLGESLVEIEVVWNSVPFTRLEQEDKLELWELFLQLGALSAITVGISMVTGLEFIWLCGKALVWMCCSAGQSSEQDNEVHRVHHPPEWYPEFDNISWHAYPKEADIEGPLGMSNSPLNRRRAYGNFPPFNEHPPQEDTQRGNTTFYQGRDSGFVYGYDENMRPVFQEVSEATHNKGNRNEQDELFSRPWERTGNSKTFTRVLVSREEIDGDGIPFLNAPGTTLKEPAMTKAADYDEDDDDDSDDDDLQLPLPLASLELDRTEHSSPELERTRHTSHDMDKTGHTSQEMDRSRQMSQDIGNTKQASRGRDRTVNMHPEIQRNREKSADNEKSAPTVQRPVDSSRSQHLKYSENIDKNLSHNTGPNTNQPVFAISGNQIRDRNAERRGNNMSRGPDLSRFHPMPLNEGPSSFQQRKHSQTNSRNMMWKNNRGLGRSKESVTRPLNETTPALGNFFPRSKIIAPNTWHHIGDEGQGRVFVPSAYMSSAYDGRTAIYRPQASYFDSSGATIRNDNGETFYLHQ